MPLGHGYQRQEPDYADEIEWFVDRACLHGILRAQGGLPGVPADEAVGLLWIRGRDHWEKAYRAVYPLVRGRRRDDRMGVCRTLAQYCVRSGTARSER